MRAGGRLGRGGRAAAAAVASASSRAGSGERDAGEGASACTSQERLCGAVAALPRAEGLAPPPASPSSCARERTHPASPKWLPARFLPLAFGVQGRRDGPGLQLPRARKSMADGAKARKQPFRIRGFRSRGTDRSCVVRMGLKATRFAASASGRKGGGAGFREWS